MEQINEKQDLEDAKIPEQLAWKEHGVDERKLLVDGMIEEYR